MEKVAFSSHFGELFRSERSRSIKHDGISPPNQEHLFILTPSVSLCVSLRIQGKLLSSHEYLKKPLLASENIDGAFSTVTNGTT